VVDHPGRVIKDPRVPTRLKGVGARQQDGNRFGLLLALLVSAYVISAFLSGYWVRVLQTTLFLGVVLIAVWTSRVSGWIRHLATGIALGGSVIALALTRIAPNGPAGGVGFTWIAVMLLLAVLIIVRRVLAQGEVTLQSIFGAVSAYMIIGLMFAACYAAMSTFSGRPFFADGQPGRIETFQYFSFTTLTTVGYGDFTAAAASGRAVAVIEALVGQVFLATLVARLVSAFRGLGPTGADARRAARPVRCPRPMAGRGRPPAARRRQAHRR
jgi:Ion channel